MYALKIKKTIYYLFYLAEFIQMDTTQRKGEDDDIWIFYVNFFIQLNSSAICQNSYDGRT